MDKVHYKSYEKIRIMRWNHNFSYCGTLFIASTKKKTPAKKEESSSEDSSDEEEKPKTKAGGHNTSPVYLNNKLSFYKILTLYWKLSFI